jgi:hypothetical protein
LSADQREEIECGAAFKEIQRIEITEGKEEGAVGKPTVISLEQAQDQWVVGSAHRYPVSLDKVHALIKRLLKIDLRVIIGRRPENHARLRVASNAYDRFIKLNIAGREVKLYVGNGKGQTLHLRFDGDDRVYRVKGLSLWSDLSVATTSYVDTSYLKVDELSALTLSGPDQRELKLTSKDGQWSLAGVEPTELDQGKVIALVDQARELSLTDVVGTEARKEYRLDQGVKVSLTPLAKEGAPSAPVNYRVGLDDQGTYYAQREGSTFIIKITSYKGKDLFEKTAETLLTEAAIEARKAPAVTEEPTSSEPALNLEGLDTAEPSPLMIPDPATPQNLDQE